MTTHTLTESGARLAVRRGDRIEIRVAENASTGFLWEVQSSPSGVRLVLSDRSMPSPMAPGQAGERILVFDVEEPAAGELQLVLRQPWDKTAAPAATFAATVAPG